jgi:predicted lipoprotein with Yx(FWY)xxD motif
MRAVRTRALLLAGPAALVLAAAAACGSSGGSVNVSSGSTGSSAASTVATSSAPSAAASGVALQVTSNSSLGQIVTTSAGMTVYRYDADSASPSKSNCSGQCVAAWPPVLVTGSAKPQVSGVSGSLVGEITRSDGTKQITLDGWPLYTYAGDTAAGQASGQGVGKSWWAVTPTGAKAAGSTSGGAGASSVASASASASASAASGGSGW